MTEDQEVMPDFIKSQDKDMKVMIDKMCQMIAKMHTQPYHHAPQAVADRNQLINNISSIKDNAAVMIDDLKEVAECVRQFMQKQSISFIMHSKAKSGGSSARDAKKISRVQVTE